MANAITVASEAFTHIIVARVVEYLRTRTSEEAVTHDELIALLTGAPAPVPAPAQVAPRAPRKSSSKKTPAEALKVLIPSQTQPEEPEAQETQPPAAQPEAQETQPPAAQPEAPETQPPAAQPEVQETQQEVPAPAAAPARAILCTKTVLGKPCTREVVKGKDVCRQCQAAQAKKEREAKKKDTAPEVPANLVAAGVTSIPDLFKKWDSDSQSLIPTQVAPPSQPAPAEAAPAAPVKEMLVPVDASKNLFRNVRTNWLIYETETESQVVGMMQGEDTVPLTKTEIEAALRAGYSVKAPEPAQPEATQPSDPEATQPDPAAASAAAPKPKPAAEPKKTTHRKPKVTVPPPPTLPIPVSDITIPL